MADRLEKMFRDSIWGGGHRIIVCATLRDFDDTKRDEEGMMPDNMQMGELFLRCIARQSYQNFRLVITTFGKKNDETVRAALDAIMGDQRDKCVVVNEEPEGYRYSMTSVLLNGIEAAKGGLDPIILWTHGDVVLQGNYFETLNKIYRDDLAGTSHPSLMTLSLKFFREQKIGVPPLYTTFTHLFFAAKLLQDEEVLGWIKKYRFQDWGLFSPFLVGLALRSQNRFNLINICDSIKILNKRDPETEPREFFHQSQARNYETLKRFVQETGADPSILKACEERTNWLHDQFKVVKTGPLQIPPQIKFSNVIDDLAVKREEERTPE